MEQRRRIFAIISALVSEDEQRDILLGAIAEAHAHNADVLVLSNPFNSLDDESFFTENDTYHLVLSPDVDGVIVTQEVFYNPTLQKKLYHLVRQIQVPVVATGDPVPFLPDERVTYICANDTADLMELTEHLIVTHGLQKIHFLSGPFALPVSQSRISGFRAAMDKHGIPYDESDIIEGDFWNTSGEALAEAYLSGSWERPEAVICASPCMAYSFIDALLAGGIRIPEDMVVVCYECTDARIRHLPVLTVCRQNRIALGRAAVRHFFPRKQQSRCPCTEIWCLATAAGVRLTPRNICAPSEQSVGWRKRTTGCFTASLSSS